MFKAIFLTLLIFIFEPVFAQSLSEDELAVIAVLDDFHDAAAKADSERYLGHMTARAVFLGTDETERFPMQPTFREYVKSRFAAGGWSYHSVNKNITFSVDQSVAWFDETSISNNTGSRFRGSGVLEKQNGVWKISQYVLSFQVDNNLWEELTELSRIERERSENSE